ncbi:hypothetical protein PP707_01180 [Acetobacter pasteurianus]|nr:hypothetical protein [Acetobacter pasteurianus]
MKINNQCFTYNTTSTTTTTTITYAVTAETWRLRTLQYENG